MRSEAHFAARVVHLLQPVLILVAVAAWVIALVGQISAYRASRVNRGAFLQDSLWG